MSGMPSMSAAVPAAALFAVAAADGTVAVIDAVRWWYPVACWGLVLAAIARSLQAGLAAAASAVGFRTSRPAAAWLPLVAGMLSAVPIDGLPLGRWLHGIDANFSIPFALVLLDFVLAPLLRRPLLDDRSRLTASRFGVVGGLLLYPLALGIGPLDPYVAGWRSPGVGVAAAGLGAALLLRRDRFGLALLAAGAAWRIGLLESTNAWDYLLDPV